MNFICDTYFKHQCRFQLLDYTDARTPIFSFKIDDDLENDFVFLKIEQLASLRNFINIGYARLPDRFTLITHNSDVNFGPEEVEYILNTFPEINHWYTQNLNFNHPKVSPIPIGIANPKWSHGNPKRFVKIIDQNLPKNNKVYVNFNISTNPSARDYCLSQIPDEYLSHMVRDYPNAVSIEDHNRFVNSTQEQYLSTMAQSYFTVSPVGNGLDCHKTWESLYMKSIPIVTRWSGVEKFKELGIPLLIIDDWSELKTLKLTPELYNDIWSDFDPQNLNFSFFENVN